MYCNNSYPSRAASMRGFRGLFAVVLAMGLGLMASPAEAAPFAYVTNSNDNTVSVIDTATNPPSVVTTVPIATSPNAVAVAPDGKRAYVASSNFTGNSIYVIDTGSNTVVATIGVPSGNSVEGIAVAPDGKHAYVTSLGVLFIPFPPSPIFIPGAITVIDTASNMVVATVQVGFQPDAVAVTPDRTRAYVTDSGYDNVLVFDTATNTVVATAHVAGSEPDGVAVTQDGKHAYAANFGPTTSR